MNQRKMVAGLRHEHMGLKDAEFFAHIDANGGWPLGYRFVGFVHSDGREAGFCNSPNNDGWWTVIASADDYYLWKLSPEALQRIADAAWKSIYLPRVELSRMRIKNSRGWEAACAAGVRAVQEPFGLVRSIIHDCPALKLPQTFLQKLGMTAQIVPLKGLTQEQAQAIVDRLNTGVGVPHHQTKPPADADGSTEGKP